MGINEIGKIEVTTIMSDATVAGTAGEADKSSESIFEGDLKRKERKEVQTAVLNKLISQLNSKPSREQLGAAVVDELGSEMQDLSEKLQLQKTIDNINTIVTEAYKKHTNINDAHKECAKKLKEANLDDKFGNEVLKLLEAHETPLALQRGVQAIKDHISKNIGRYVEYLNVIIISEKALPLLSVKEIIEEVQKDIKAGTLNVDKKVLEQYESELLDYTKTCIQALIVHNEQETKGNQIRKDIKDIYKEQHSWDKTTRKALKSETSKISADVQGRTNNVAQTTGELKTKDEIVKEIGSELFNKIAKYIETTDENGNIMYDLQKLASDVRDVVGADYQLSRHNKKIDSEIAEKPTLAKDLAEKTDNVGNLTEKEAKKLAKLCGFDIEHKDWKKVISNTVLGGLLGAGAGAGAAATNPSQKYHINVNQDNRLELNLKGLEGGSINMDALQDSLKGIEGVTITQTVGGLQIIIENFQKLAQVLEASKHVALTAIKVGALGAALGALKGLEDTGEIAVAPTNFNYETLEDYLTSIKGNPYEKQLAALAAAYVEKDGSWDKAGYLELLNRAAGNGSKLNKEELIGAMNERFKELQNTQETTETEIDTNIDTNDDPDIAEVKKVTTKGHDEKKDITYIHERQYGDTWKGIVEAYYPGLADKLGGLWGKDGAIKRLQRELCTDENGVFNAELFKDLISRTNLPEKIKLPSEIDGIKRQDGKVEKATAEELGGPGKGKGGMKEIGRNEYDITKIPGTELWKATDKETGLSVTGKTPHEAVQTLEEATGKDYDIIKIADPEEQE